MSVLWLILVLGLIRKMAGGVTFIGVINPTKLSQKCIIKVIAKSNL